MSIEKILFSYSLVTTCILIFIITYEAYRHKNYTRKKIILMKDALDQVNQCIKTYNTEMEQLIRTLHNVRIMVKDISISLNIKNEMEEYTHIKFERIEDE